MSQSAYLKLKMTEPAVIRKMCERQGMSVRFRDAQRRVTTKDKEAKWAIINIDPSSRSTWRNQINVDLTGKQDTSYDGDFRSSFLDRFSKTGVKQGHRDWVRTADELIGESLDNFYQEAATICTAEESGWDWEEGLTKEGTTWISVLVPNDVEMFEEATYE